MVVQSYHKNNSFLSPSSQKKNVSNHRYHLNKDLGNLLILGDLNSDLKENFLNVFSDVNNLKSLNKEPTCF